MAKSIASRVVGQQQLTHVRLRRGAGGWEGEPDPGLVSYRVHMIAPFGQGWVTSPENCSGVGSDNLTCEFTANDLAGQST